MCFSYVVKDKPVAEIRVAESLNDPLLTERRLTFERRSSVRFFPGKFIDVLSGSSIVDDWLRFG